MKASTTGIITPKEEGKNIQKDEKKITKSGSQSNDDAPPTSLMELIEKFSSFLKQTFGKDASFLLITDLELTLEEYFAITKEELKYKTELHHGRLVIQSPASEPHEGTFGFLHLLLASYLTQRRLGRVYGSRYKIVLSNQHSYEPDLFAITPDQLPHVQHLAFHGVPKLIFEIISPSTKHYDLVEKAEVYQTFGVQEYWTVNNQNQSVMVFYLEENNQYSHVLLEKEGIIRSKVFPGFWLRVEWLWQRDQLRPSDVLPILLESEDLAEYIKTHGVEKAIKALGVDLVLQAIDWTQQPPSVLENLPTALLERLPDSVLERLPDSVLERLPDSVLERLPDSVLERLPDSCWSACQTRCWHDYQRKDSLASFEIVGRQKSENDY